MKMKKRLTVLLGCAVMIAAALFAAVGYARASETAGTAVGTFEELQEAARNKTAAITLTASVEITEPLSLENMLITTTGSNTLRVEAALTLNQVTINAEMNPGYAPITLTENGAELTGNGLTINRTGSSRMGYTASAQAVQIDTEPGTGGASPENVRITLTGSSLLLDGEGARGICFAGASDGTSIILDDTKIYNGTDSKNEWKGGQSRGIALFNASDMDIQILNNSEVCGWQYAVNSGCDTGTETKGLSVTVDHSLLSGWTAFNIWTSGGTFDIRNHSELRGQNGSYNSDKVYSFSAFVINDDIYDRGDPTAVNSKIIITDSRVVAETKDNQPEETLICVESASNTYVYLKGTTELVRECEGDEMPWGFHTLYIGEDEEAFIREQIQVEPTVTCTNVQFYAATHKQNGEEYDAVDKYALPVLKSQDETMGTVAANQNLYKAGDRVNTSVTPKEGYTFAGWYAGRVPLEGDASHVILPDTLDDYKVEITAKWEQGGSEDQPSEPSGGGGSGTGTEIYEVEASKDGGSTKAVRAEVTTKTENGAVDMQITVPSEEIARLSEEMKATAENPLELTVPIPAGKLTETISDVSVSAAAVTVKIDRRILEDETIQIARLVLEDSVLNAAASAGRNLQVAVEDETGRIQYSWTIDGSDLAADRKYEDVNLAVEAASVKTVENAGKIIEKDKNNQSGVVVCFAEEGTFPVQGTVKVNVGAQQGLKAGRKVYVYKVNEATGKLETLPFSSGYKLDADGYVTLGIVSGGNYVILAKETSANVMTTLRNQIKVSNRYSLEKGQKKSVKVTLPETLQRVERLGDNTAFSKVGGVTVRFQSSDSKIVSVNKTTGKMTAKKKGTVTVTAVVKLYSGKVKTVKIKVTVK